MNARSRVVARSVLAAASLCLVGSLQEPASAQQVPAATPTGNADSSNSPAADDAAGDTQARVQFERNVEFADQGRWGDAIDAFESALRIRGTAAVRFNLAMAYRAVGRSREALQMFGAFVQTAGARMTAARLEEVERYTRELRATVGGLRLRVDPASAHTTLDGSDVTIADTWLDIDPGRHEIVAEHPGHRTIRRTVRIGRGERLEMDVHLVRDASGGRVFIDASVASALIRIDGQPVSSGVADEYLPAGDHTIVVGAPGYSTFSRTLTVAPGGTYRVRAVLSDQRTVLASPWFWGAAAIVVGGGITITLVATTRVEPPLEGVGIYFPMPVSR